MTRKMWTGRLAPQTPKWIKELQDKWNALRPQDTPAMSQGQVVDRAVRELKEKEDEAAEG